MDIDHSVRRGEQQLHHGPATHDVAIRLAEAGKRYPDGTVAIQSLSLEVRRGEVVALVGPSGCGKSTALRMVNRLVEPTSGSVEVDGAPVGELDPVELRRGIGYVIQRVGLFPHQRVGDNVATVPRMLGWDRTRIRHRVTELLELVGLDPLRYARRYPDQLSGGEAQRVGVARALAADPPILLMDEPFGAVDPLQRGRLQDEFRSIQTRLRKTVLLVTHDIDEAFRLADRVAVLSGHGVLEQLASPQTIVTDPANGTVSTFLGTADAVRRLDVVPLTRESVREGRPGTVPGPSVALGSTMREALTALLSSGGSDVTVVDRDGRPCGVLTADSLVEGLRLQDR